MKSEIVNLLALVFSWVGFQSKGTGPTIWVSSYTYTNFLQIDFFGLLKSLLYPSLPFQIKFDRKEKPSPTVKKPQIKRIHPSNKYIVQKFLLK